VKAIPWLLPLIILWVSAAQAKVDLVSLPARDDVQLTIYNSADLTLVRENRLLTLKEGLNELQFSWANTLIDPTSLEMWPKADAGKIDIAELTYPPRTRNIGLWHIQSALSGQVPVAINYLTSGLSWRAFYLGTLTPDEKAMRLEGYVRVMNNSGEDYENAQVRLIVGKVHMIDDIAELARREYPYGRPGYDGYARQEVDRKEEAPRALMRAFEAVGMDADVLKEAKQIIKEGLSEYFLYTIEGTETIPTGWSKRLPSLEADSVPVVNLYKYEEERYGNFVVRFVSFKNDKQHKLGETPIPDGVIKVFRSVDAVEHLSYEGQANFKYIPVDEEAELNLGEVANVIVKPVMMDFRTQNYLFDNGGNVSGWEEVKEFKVEVKNTRGIPVKVEIQRNFGGTSWKIINSGDSGKYEKIDADTVKYALELPAKSNKEFKYVLTTAYGRRAER